MIQSDKNSNLTFDIIFHAEHTPQATALIFENREINYQELNEIVWRVTNFLCRNGVGPGQVIGIFSQENISTILLMLGIARVGATVFSLPKSASLLQLQEMLVGANVNKIVSDHNLPLVTNLPVFLFKRDSLNQNFDLEKSSIDPNPISPWIIICGSGTTGKPKLIPISHQAQRVRSEMSDEWLSLTCDDRVASLSHFDFTHPKNRLLETLWAGGSYLVETSKKNIVEACETHNLTVLHATVFHITYFLRNSAPEEKNLLPKLRVLGMSASTISQTLRHQIREKLTKNLIVRYASNETGPISFARYPEVFEKSETVGKPLKNVNVKILDKPNNLPSENLEGLIAIESPANFSGYVGDPEITADRFSPYGFIPNDVVRLDSEGHIIFLGRSDQMMIYNGINIYPAEVERLLAQHHAVEDSICFPLAHPVHQDVPVAAVSIKPYASVTEVELLKYCAQALGSHRPHRVFIIENIPRNVRGKIDRPALMAKIKEKYI